MAEHVADATYERINPRDDWYTVVIPGEPRIGEVWKTKRGYLGACDNAPKSVLGPYKSKELLGPIIVGKWESFPVRG